MHINPDVTIVSDSVSPKPRTDATLDRGSATQTPATTGGLSRTCKPGDHSCAGWARHLNGFSGECHIKVKTMDYVRLPLAEVLDEADAIAADANTLFGHLNAQQINWKPGVDRLSDAQCLEHRLQSTASTTRNSIRSSRVKRRPRCGIALGFGENSSRYFDEPARDGNSTGFYGFTTTADPTSRLGRISRAHNPVHQPVRCPNNSAPGGKRFKISNWCLYRTDWRERTARQE